MTTERLSQLFGLSREVNDLETRVEELRARAESVTPTLTGMPGGNNSGRGTHEQYVIIYADMMDQLVNKLAELSLMRHELVDWLDNANDTITWRAVMYRYYDGLTWKEVAGKLGPGFTEESVRKRCTRFVYQNCEV